METWLSGRKHLTANEAGSKSPPGFESLRLRQPMKLVSVNIEVNRHYDTVLDFLKKENPDVICLQELLEEDFPVFQRELRIPGKLEVFSCPSSYYNLEGKWQGVAIFAKNIVNSGSIFYTSEKRDLLKTYNPEPENSVLVWADVKDAADSTYRIVTTHLPVTTHGESTPYQLQVVDLLLQSLVPLGEFVLCGDMNAPRGNETFSRIAQKYTDNIPPEYKTSIDQNLHRVKGIQLMVDGLFTTPKYTATNVRLVDGVSDHMAIVSEISYP